MPSESPNPLPDPSPESIPGGATAPDRLLVSDAQVQAAMAHYERIHGRGDGISISREVSALADLLGAMWYAHESEASIPSSSKIGQLLRESGVLPAPAGSSSTE